MRLRPNVIGRHPADLRRAGRLALASAAGAVLAAMAAPSAQAARSAPIATADISALAQLSIEQLADLDINSVSKTDQPLSEAPAAVYVITPQDILRSGADELPEILRLAPNLHVAQITAGNWAISARGFNGSAADKLLVLIDGRSVYTPFHNGVFWEVQHVPPENIERIEVISGPGATLWGANAVNGVINVITRKASDTPGALVAFSGGSLQRRGLLQLGAPLGATGAIRAYLDVADHGANVTASGADARDDWTRLQAGFRADWETPGDLVTVQGYVYTGSQHEFRGDRQRVWGHNVIARWTHDAGAMGSLRLQAYYDRIHRSVVGVFKDDLSTYDVELQHGFSLGRAHQIVWGGGYRLTQDDFPIVPGNPTTPFTQFFIPQGRTLSLGNVFAQDTITLTPALKLTLGLKLEKDPYIPLEPLPSARLAFTPADGHMFWASVSRAIRAPSRLDEDFGEDLGKLRYLRGGGFLSEKLIAYELGYRTQPTSRLSASISGFYNVYRDLRSFEWSPSGTFPIMFRNLMEGETWGIEAWGAYQLKPWWRVSLGANWLHKDLRFKASSSKLTSTAIAGNDPDYQLSLRSMIELAPDVSFDFDIRRVGALPSPASPAYTELGMRLGWMVNKHVELAITGSNLLNEHHPEFGSGNAQVQLGSSGVETGRNVSLDARWRF